MRPFETLETVEIPGGELTLHRHDGELYIYLNGEELMSTRVKSSESALGALAGTDLPDATKPRVLIGGLGLGFTLRSTLAALSTRGSIVVAELFPAVVDWNRRYVPESAAAMNDRRVTIDARDVREVIATSPAGAFHGIFLDVDNGPSAWCLESNGALYERRGLAQIFAALAPGGLLAIWSAYSDPTFKKKLARSGFQASIQRHRGHEGRGPRHTLFLGRRPGPR